MKTVRLVNDNEPLAIASPDALEFTGERIVPGKTQEILFREHEERYVFAGQYAAGKAVLDLACGTGIGASYLKKAGARSVLGVDIDSKAVGFARAAYPDCEFHQSSATDLRLSDSSMDVVVSFETIEHLNDQRKFLSECRRVLRPGGLLICSTPNTTMYRWQSANPHHVRELTLREFERLVGEYFCELRLFSQAERVYPIYLARLFIVRVFEILRLKEAIKLILRRPVAPEPFRINFAGKHSDQPDSIVPYRSGIFAQPMYVIIVGARPSE